MRIFISHLWTNYDLYLSLKHKINPCKRLWVDFSIPIDHMIKIEEYGIGARKQEIDLQKSTLKMLIQEINNEMGETLIRGGLKGTPSSIGLQAAKMLFPKIDI